jgi:hypothetical protein
LGPGCSLIKTFFSSLSKNNKDLLKYPALPGIRDSVTRLGEILLFGYFLLEHIFTFSAKADSKQDLMYLF